MESARAIVITGPVGVGKTAVMVALTELLEDLEQPCAGVDMDNLRWFYPTPAHDRFGSEIGRKHLAYLAASYHELGVRMLVLADVIEHEDDRAALVVTMPDYDVHVVRLRVPMDMILQRLMQRESPERLQWYLDRAPELERIMDDADVGDTVIDVGNHTPREIAQEIAGLLGLF